MKKYKLVCVDLDGTLLDSQRNVSENNKLAIRKALDYGIKVMIVSGRPNYFTANLIRQIDARMGHITFNGGYYQIEDKSNTTPVDIDTVKTIAKYAQEQDIRVYFKDKNKAICAQSDDGVSDYEEYRHLLPVEEQMTYYYNVDVIQYFEENTMGVLKILCRDHDYEKVKQMLAFVKPLSKVNVYPSERLFECCSCDINKGKAIQKVCEQLHISQEEIVCIGDNFNDIAMFDIAGLSIAMENAPLEIKKKCCEVTLSNDEDGVAYAIENYVLK